MISDFQSPPRFPKDFNSSGEFKPKMTDYEGEPTRTRPNVTPPIITTARTYRDVSPGGIVETSPNGELKVTSLSDIEYRVIKNLNNSPSLVSTSTEGAIFSKISSSTSTSAPISSNVSPQRLHFPRDELNQTSNDDFNPSNSISFGTSIYPNIPVGSDYDLNGEEFGEGSDSSGLHYHLDYHNNFSNSTILIEDDKLEGSIGVDGKHRYEKSFTAMAIKYHQLKHKFNEEISKYSMEKRRLHSIIDSKMSEISNLNSIISGYKNEINISKQQVTTKTEQILNLRETIKSFSEKAEKTEKLLTEKINQEREKNIQNEKEINKLKHQEKVLKSEIESYKELLLEKEKTIESKDNALFDLQANSSSVSSSNFSNSKEMFELKSQIELKNKELKEYHTKLNQKDEFIKQIQMKLVQTEEKLSSLSSTHSNATPSLTKEEIETIKNDIKLKFEEEYKKKNLLLLEKEKDINIKNDELLEKEKNINIKNDELLQKEKKLEETSLKISSLSTLQKSDNDNENKLINNSITTTNTSSTTSTPSIINKFNIQYILDYNLRERSLIIFKKNSSTFYLILLSFAQIIIWFLLVSCGIMYLELNNISTYKITS